MKRVLAVVRRQHVVAAVEREAAPPDAVGDPADRGAEAGMVALVILGPVEPENHVGGRAATVGER